MLGVSLGSILGSSDKHTSQTSDVDRKGVSRKDVRECLNGCTFVYGVPLGLGGNKNVKELKAVEEFVLWFRKQGGRRVVGVDERYSSKEGRMEMNIKGVKGRDDGWAAKNILERFLDDIQEEETGGEEGG